MYGRIQFFLFLIYVVGTTYAGPMDDAEKYYLKGLYSRAVEACRKSLQYDMNKNNRAHIWYIMGQSRLMQGNTKKARQAFATILSRYADTGWLPHAYVGIGDAHFKEGNYATALQYYKNSMSRKYLSQHGAAVYYRLARAHRKAGNNAKAQYFEKVIQGQYPHSLEARVLLAKGRSGGPSASSRRRLYTVQISYTTRADYAREYAQKFQEKGYDAFVRVTESQGRQRFKVLVGKYNSFEAAQAVMRRLKRQENVEAFITHITE